MKIIINTIIAGIIFGVVNTLLFIFVDVLSYFIIIIFFIEYFYLSILNFKIFYLNNNNINLIKASLLNSFSLYFTKFISNIIVQSYFKKLEYYLFEWWDYRSAISFFLICFLLSLFYLKIQYKKSQNQSDIR